MAYGANGLDVGQHKRDWLITEILTVTDDGQIAGCDRLDRRIPNERERSRYTDMVALMKSLVRIGLSQYRQGERPKNQAAGELFHRHGANQHFRNQSPRRS